MHEYINIFIFINNTLPIFTNNKNIFSIGSVFPLYFLPLTIIYTYIRTLDFIKLYRPNT